MRKFLDNIEIYKLIEEGDTIVIGVSGGADSIFLLEMLYSIKDRYKLNLIIAHVNHGVRGEDADSDQNFVQRKAETLKLLFETINVDMNEYAREHGMSAEDAGRLLRYNFFYKLAGKDGKIAVAHNREDQAETVFMRIIRGTGVDGLAAMRYSKGKIIRPILNISRSDIENYLHEREIEYVTDLTNLETDYMRNKLRLETMPLISSQYNPKFIDNLFNLSMIAKEESDYLEIEASRAYNRALRGEHTLSISTLKREHPAIIKRTLRCALSKINNSLKEIGNIHIDQIIYLMEGQSGKHIDLPQGIIAQKSFDELLFTTRVCKSEDIIRLLLLMGINNTKLGLFTLEEVSERGKSTKNNIFIDGSKVRGNLYIRTRKDGDIFAPLGMKGRKKLKDFFIDSKIPIQNRDKIPILCDDENIIWVAGYRMSEDYKVGLETNNIISIKYEV